MLGTHALGDTSPFSFPKLPVVQKRERAVRASNSDAKAHAPSKACLHVKLPFKFSSIKFHEIPFSGSPVV
jgi:hypothetical protein